MISNQIIKSSLDDLHGITKVDFAVYDLEGTLLTASGESTQAEKELVGQFSASPADSQEIRGFHYFKVFEENEPVYILTARGFGEDVHMVGKIAVSQIQGLIVAYQDRFDRNTFIQNLLLDNLLLVDIYNRAKKLNIAAQARRLVYIIETSEEEDNTSMEIMKSIFGGKNFITAVDEKMLILVQELEERQGYEYATETSQMICDMLGAEAMLNARVAFGTIVDDIQQVSRSYKEAKMALDVGKIFYAHKRIHAYNTLGIGRLIYQLPVNLCEMFMNEVFKKQAPNTFDDETLVTIERFFENNLNVSETARKLFVHRNTLVYRLEKLEKSTGLDIRNFEDALTFRIGLMVVNYMKYMQEQR